MRVQQVLPPGGSESWTVLDERFAVVEPVDVEADGTHITVTAPAKAAGVARSWVYTQPDLMDRIAATPQRPARPVPTRKTDESWQRRRELAHQRIKDLTGENNQLRCQLALAHGQSRAEQIASVRTLSSR